MEKKSNSALNAEGQKLSESDGLSSDSLKVNGKSEIIGKAEEINKVSGERRKKVLIIFAVIAAVLTVATILCLIFLPNKLVEGIGKVKIKKKIASYISIIAVYALTMLATVLVTITKFKRGVVVKKPKAEFFNTKNITRTAVFSALAIVLYYFVKFPLPIFPSFLDVQFSDLPALLAGYMMGPVSGSIVIIIKFLVKLPASTTMCIGETVDLILGLSFVIPATIIYRRKKNMKYAIISLVAGSIICVTVATLANWLIVVRAYIALLYSGDWSVLLKAMNAIFKGKITEQNFYSYYIFLSVIPFNILRCLITSILTFLLYKSLKKFFDRLTA